MLAVVESCSIFGIEAFHVTIEVAIAPGLPQYRVVGLPATPVKEGAVRIHAALKQVGQGLPDCSVTVNLAPADRPKRGSAFDLPIAVGVLVADRGLPAAMVRDLLWIGELGLDGRLRAVPGALSAAMLARDRGLRGVVVPASSAAEAAVVDGVEVYAVDHLGQVIGALEGAGELPRFTRPAPTASPAPATSVDMSDVRGQHAARLALEVAVAGGHNLLLVGPPGIGKTMLARRVPTILPELSYDEALETTRVYSAAGLAGSGLVRDRPFRAPHHTVSRSALLGGGSIPRPGEISLAHNGVLFLDELPEFSRATIEALRQPLEDREVTIGRVAGTATIPSAFLLVASANPCPCGWLGATQRACTCGLGAIRRYRSRLSGPLLDRIDLQVYVPPVELAELRSGAPGESSARVRERIAEARTRQAARLARWGARCNAEMSPRAARDTCRLTAAAERTLARLHQVRPGMSGRAVDRIIKVARTVTDLMQQDTIDAGAIREAAAYRALDTDPVTAIRSESPHGDDADTHPRGPVVQPRLVD